MSMNTRKTYSLAGSWRPDDLVVSFMESVIYLLGWVSSNEQVVLTLSCETGEIHARWPVVKMPCRLSVDAASNCLLMACKDGLRSYSSSGLLKSIIPVKVDLGTVWHAVQIPTYMPCSRLNRCKIWILIAKLQTEKSPQSRDLLGMESESQRYAICYGLSNNEPHGVSVIDNSGNVLHTFGGTHAGSADKELNRPIQLAVDTNIGVIFVLDSGNNAVKILNLSDTKLLDVYLHPEMSDPRRLAVDPSTRCMAIAAEDGRVLLFSY